MADKKFPDDEEIFDLTDLIESGTATQAGGAAAYAKAASSANNFESFLSDLNEDGADSAVDANEKLDMSSMGDIENLLDSFDIPAQPAPDSAVAPPAAPKKAAPAAPPADELDNLLDDWLNPAGGNGQPSPEQTPSAPLPDEGEIDADLHSILNEAGDLAAPVETAAAPSSLDMEDIDLPEPPDFDDIPPAAASAGTEITLSEEVAKEDTQAPPEPEISAPSMPDPVNNSTEIPGGVYSVRPVQEMTVAPEMLANIYGGLLKAQGTASEEALRDFAHKLGHQEGDIENLGKRVEELAQSLRENGGELAATREQLALVEKNSHGLEELFSEGTPLNAGFMKLIGAVVGQALENGKKAVPDEELTRKLNKLEENAAPVEESLAALGSRLDALEAEAGLKPDAEALALEPLREKLANLESLLETVSGNFTGLSERITLLENDAAAPVNIDATEILARLDRMEGQEAGILAKFAGVEGRLDSLESGLGDAMTRIDEIRAAELGDRLDKVAQTQKSINARIDALEKRLDELEPRFNADIEKAAAKSVVKILHEEIARLMAGN